MYQNYQSTVKALEPIEATHLIRMVYVSKATLFSRINAAQTLARIESVAVAQNAINELSGVLCYGNGYFLQCLEGEKQKVLPLVARICADKRHKNITVIDAKAIDSTRFKTWGMRSLLLEDWMWRDIHPEYVQKLGRYIPFLPHKWPKQSIEDFLEVINRTDIPFISHKR